MCFQFACDIIGAILLTGDWLIHCGLRCSTLTVHYALLSPFNDDFWATLIWQRPNSSGQVFVRTKSRQSETVSQILQQTAAAGTPAARRLQLPASIADHIRPAAVQPGPPPKVSVPKTAGNMRWISSLGQTRLVMPSEKGIVITQLPSESGEWFAVAFFVVCRGKWDSPHRDDLLKLACPLLRVELHVVCKLFS